MSLVKRNYIINLTRMRHNHPRLDCTKANSFQDRDADTEGSDVIPNKMATTNARTPEKIHQINAIGPFQVNLFSISVSCHSFCIQVYAYRFI